MAEADKEAIYAYDKLRNTDVISLEANTVKVDDNFVEPTSIEMNTILRKLDIRTVPLITFLCLIFFLGRFDIGDKKYTQKSNMENFISLSMPFVAYSLFEVPSHMLLKKIGLSKWFANMAFIRALAIFRLATVTSSSAESLVLRIILTSVEASLFSDTMFYTRSWYPKIRKSQKIRLFYLFLWLYASFAFAILVFYIIIQIDDQQFLLGWRKTEIISISFTLLLMILSCFAFPDFPENCKFLTEREHDIIRRLHADDNDLEQPTLAWKPLRLTTPDLKSYVSGFLTIYYVNLVCNLAYNAITGLSDNCAVTGIAFIHIDGWDTPMIASYQCLVTLLVCQAFLRFKKWYSR